MRDLGPSASETQPLSLDDTKGVWKNFNTLLSRADPGTTKHEKRGEGGWTLKRRFHPGFHMMGYTTPPRPSVNNLCSRQNPYDAFPVGTGLKFRLLRFNKGEVYMKLS